MEMLKDFLGFAVLTSPFWLILIMLPVSIWIAVKVAKHFKRMSARLVGGVGIFFIVFLVPFSDEVVGRMYFNYLCANEAGVKVYQTVELPSEYWDEQGRALFYDAINGNFTLDGYRVEYKTGVYSPLFHIDNAGYKRINDRSGQVLGEITDFMYWGGWVRRNLSPHNTANACKNRREYSRSLIKQIFKRKGL